MDTGKSTKRLVVVPFWFWMLWFSLELLGADSGWQIIGYAWMLLLPWLAKWVVEVPREDDNADQR